MDIRPIGNIRSCFKEKFITPRQAGMVENSRATIEFYPEIQPHFALRGIEQFSFIWVIWWFHQNSNSSYSATVSPPRLQGQKVGCLASRSPHRPNPIGLSAVQIVNIGENFIEVDGVDFVDGTPVLDIKPYIKEYDAKFDARSGYIEEAPFSELNVEFTTDFHSQLSDFNIQSELIRLDISEDNLRAAITQLICNDPRPSQYKGSEPNLKQLYGFKFYNFNIQARIEDNSAKVLNISNIH